MNSPSLTSGFAHIVYPSSTARSMVRTSVVDDSVKNAARFATYAYGKLQMESKINRTKQSIYRKHWEINLTETEMRMKKPKPNSRILFGRDVSLSCSTPALQNH